MIDWVHIGNLIEEFGREDFEEIVLSLWQELDAAIAELEKTAHSDPRLGEIMHFIKGSAANLGLSELAAFTGEQERLTQAKAYEDLNPSRAKSLYKASRELMLTEGPTRFTVSFG